MKIEKVTPDKPEIEAIADLLGLDPDAVFGKCFRIWSWFDDHTLKGNAPTVTKALLDRKSRVTGFGDAMEKVGWLVNSDDGLSLPNFDRHCGESAKQRSLTAKRVAKSKKGNAIGNGKVTQAALPESESESESVREERLRPGGKLFSGFDGLDQEGMAEVLSTAKRISKAIKVAFDSNAHLFVAWAHADFTDKIERGSVDDIINKMAGRYIRDRLAYFEKAIQERYDERNGHG